MDTIANITGFLAVCALAGTGVNLWRLRRMYRVGRNTRLYGEAVRLHVDELRANDATLPDTMRFRVVTEDDERAYRDRVHLTTGDS